MPFGRRDLSFAMVLVLALLAQAFGSLPASAADPLTIRISWIGQDEGTALPPLSLVEPRELPDEGLAGATLGIADNQTTGGFLGQTYELNEVMVPADGDPVEAARKALAAGEKLIVVDLLAEDLQAIADLPEAEGALIFNARAEDDLLRTEECRANVFHIIPSRAMKADALAQYLVWKRWNRWFLIHGERPADLAFAEALRRSAQKFNGKIVEEREYAYNPTSRVTDSGHVQVQRQIPVFTQDAPDHDVVLVADESDVFGEFLPYHTWDPRPVVGTQGLVPTAWSRVQEQWGGTQMQSRFEDHANRWMRERDYTGWLAVRTIGEAVTRTGKADPASIRDYVRSDQFKLGAFKGEPLTFRSWNQQMRQPVLLASPRMLVSVSPQEQFLHQRTPLDTLGFDQPESSCDLQ
jgi:ABC transporter substrate binding protein (PQQ-dependent alcohol dehydrogenase system)